MLAWAILGAGLLALVLAARIGARRARGLAQGCAMLAVATGGLLLLFGPGPGARLPGHGPRRWHQP